MGQLRQSPRDVEHPTTDVVVYDLETVVEVEPADGRFPPVPEHRIVAGAFLRATWTPGDHYLFDLSVPFAHPGEEARFFENADRCLAGGPVGVGFNSRSFDNPVLRAEAWRCGMLALPNVRRQTQSRRFGIEHCDLRDLLANFGGSASGTLATVCEPLRIPVKTTAHGSDVAALWRAGDHATIAAYVAEDVVATYLVFLHLAAWKADDPSLMILPASDLAIWIESRADLAHLRPFATCPPVAWARQRAPALRADRACTATERRLAHQRDEVAFTF